MQPFAIRFFLFCSILGTALNCAPTHAATPAACGQASVSAVQVKLRRLLEESGAPNKEQAFLLDGAARRVQEIRRESLNDAGRRCGLEAVRALVLSCLAQTLPAALRAVPSPERRVTYAEWGRTELSAREVVFIGMFHACRGAAMETFLSGR